MQVDTMRKIDRWVGIPLCFIVDIVYRVMRIGKPWSQPKPQNALFIELSEMGSTILVDPAMRYLQRQAGSDLYFVIFAKNLSSLEILNTIPRENIFTLRDTSIFGLALDTLKFLVWCRKRKIDTVVDLELFSRFTALLTALCGASYRVGFYSYHEEGLYRGDMLTHKVAYNPHQHISKNFMALMHAVLSPSEELPFSKAMIQNEDIILEKAECSVESRGAIGEKIVGLYPSYNSEHHRIVLMNPNASDMLPQRRWPRESFKEVIRKLLNEFEDVVVIITGAPSEREGADLLARSVAHERCLNSAGYFKFKELVPLYYLSTLMLTNDSGPAHFSAATPLKTFVLFGPETPNLYGSLGNSTPIYAGLSCSPCVSAYNHRKTDCVDNQCLKRIEVDEVYCLVSGYLEGS